MVSTDVCHRPFSGSLSATLGSSRNVFVIPRLAITSIKDNVEEHSKGSTSPLKVRRPPIEGSNPNKSNNLIV